MSSTGSFIGAIGTAVGSIGGGWAVLRFFMGRREREREAWFVEAQKSYERVSSDCENLRGLLNASEERRTESETRHQRELEMVRRELADVRDALFVRLDAFDEVLPYVQGMPDEKVRELRAANRATRSAAYRGR
jgi:hypothetical protein